MEGSGLRRITSRDANCFHESWMIYIFRLAAVCCASIGLCTKFPWLVEVVNISVPKVLKRCAMLSTTADATTYEVFLYTQVKIPWREIVPV